MKKVYIQVSTHWDREWYNPFQAFRYELVRTTDKILKEIESKETIDNFMFDGQTIVLEDYLEIMPQDEARVKDAISKGSLMVGPWYVMPDEWLVSGESLIHNFLQGKRVCEKFGGKPYLFGYVNDVFGHIAQFPQILNQLGIQMTYMSRGVSGPNHRFRHFVWEAPDGSRCFGYKFDYPWAFFAYQRFLQSGDKTEEEKDNFVREFLLKEMEKSGQDVVLLNITKDHAYLTDEMLDYIRRVKKIKDIEIIDAGFDKAYGDLLKIEQTLPKVSGELLTSSCDGESMRLVLDSISSYYPLKEQNDHCQNVLENQTAPMVAYSRMAGEPLRHEFVRMAYKELLKNHAHDDICGCSCDQVHKDMLYRYDQVKEIAKAIERDFVCKFAPETGATGDRYVLSVFNPTPAHKEQVIVVDLDFQKDFSKQFAGNAPYQPKNTFKLVDATGKVIDYQILKVRNNRFDDRYNIPQEKKIVDIYTVAFEAELPAFGVAKFAVEPADGYIRHHNTMRSGDNWMENEYVRVDIQSNGTLTLLDKVTGKVYKDLNYFVDDAEAGNGWFHEPALGDDSAISTRFCGCTVEKIHAGSFVTTFRITKDVEIPARLDYDQACRSKEKVTMRISSEVSLMKGSAAVEIETTVENVAKDHRLRLMLPTGVAGDQYRVSQPFCFADRMVGADADTLTWWEPQTEERHFDGILYKKDASGNGLAFVGKAGFHQAGVLNDGEAIISVVLLRCFGRAHWVNEPMESQLQGKHVFRYSIVPVNETVNEADLLNIRKNSFSQEISSFVKSDKDISDTLSADNLLVSGENVSVSIIKAAENNEQAIVVRLFNIGAEATTAKLKFGDFVKYISTTDLYENKIETLVQDVAEADVQLRPFEIKTLEIGL